jgi:hypothetical protein
MRQGWLPIALLAALAATAARADEISSGELQILYPPPKQDIPYHSKTLTIVPTSLRDGWVRNSQCLTNIDWWGDAVQIVFGAGKVRKLKITRAENIAKSWVEGPTVQLEGVAKRAVLCLTSENRIFINDGSLALPTLKVGPFMFQLFDGFFPMRLSMRIEYPPDLLSFDSIKPGSQPGVEVIRSPGQILYQTTFDGILWVHVRFREASDMW